MKRMIPIVITMLAISASAFAQDPNEKAVSAAPAALREGATVIKWKADFTYDTVKKGTGPLVCYDRSGDPSQQAFAVECTSNIANLDRVAQNRKFEAISDKAARKTAMDAAEANGTRVKPAFGSVWYHMDGPDQAHARTHMTIAVPGATTATLGLPDNGKAGGVWIMNAGTTTAHLMTPGE